MMLRKMMIALALCGLTTGALAQGGKMDTKDTGKGKTEKKAGPARDAKGRFVKKGTADMKTTGKKLPPRDAKGRFMKKDTAGKMTDKKPTSTTEKKK